MTENIISRLVNSAATLFVNKEDLFLYLYLCLAFPFSKCHSDKSGQQNFGPVWSAKTASKIKEEKEKPHNETHVRAP